MPILSTRNIAKCFDGVRAVDGLSIAIERGRITGIIGPNGSGKTTLVNLLSGMVPMDGGTVMISEIKMKIRPHAIASFGITRTFQDVRLFEQMTVLDNILVVLTERSFIKSLFEKRKRYHLKTAEEMLRKVGLWEKRNQLAENLSYGQRKVLEISRALAMKAEIYLFDEPFAGLFPEMAKIVSGVLEELKQANKAVILIEHNMELIRRLSDYVFVMDEGKLLAEGESEKVLEKREVIEAYLGE